MAGEHVEEEVEGSPSPGSLHEYSSGVDDLRSQGEETQQSREVLKEHHKSQRILRVQRGRGTVQAWNHHPDHKLYANIPSTRTSELHLSQFRSDKRKLSTKDFNLKLEM